MDSIRQPFFASAVATVDRVLASQVTSIFSTQILNNLKPEDIGAAPSTWIINPESQVRVYASGATDLNLLSSVGTKVDLFTVPTGYRFICDQFFLLFTTVTQNGSAMVGSTQPSVRVIKNNSNASTDQLNNEIALGASGNQTVQIVNKFWSSSGSITGVSGKATAGAGDVVSAYITTAWVAGTNPYTALTAKCSVNGILIPV